MVTIKITTLGGIFWAILASKIDIKVVEFGKILVT